MKSKRKTVKRVSKRNNSKKIDFGLVVNKKGTDRGSMDFMLKMGTKTNKYNKNRSSKLINSKNTKRPYGEFSKELHMNWKQVKKRFPGISPYGDADFDGSYNKIDCQPLNPGKDGKFTDFLGSVKERFKGATQKEKKDPTYQKAIAKEKATKKFFEGKTAEEVVGAIRYKGKPTKLKKKRIDIEEIERLGAIARLREKVVLEKISRGQKAEKQKLFDKVGARVQREIDEERRPELERKARVKAKTQKILKGAVFGTTAVVVGKGGKITKRTTGGAIRQGQQFSKVIQKAAGVPTKDGTVKGVKAKKSTTGLVGRPAGQYKTRINPFTNQPIQIPATEYYKLIDKFKDIQKLKASTIAQQTDTAQVQALAQRGIPPEQAKQIVDTRQLQSVIPEGYHIMQNGEPRLMKDTEMEQQYPQIQEAMPQEQAIEPQIDNTAEVQERMARLREIKEQKRLQRVSQQTSQTLPQIRQQYQQMQRLPQQFQQVPQFKEKKDIMTGRIIREPIKQPERWERPPQPNRVPV